MWEGECKDLSLFYFFLFTILRNVNVMDHLKFLHCGYDLFIFIY